MSRELLQLLLIQTFGRGSRNPLHGAVIKLCSSVLAAIVIGVLVARAVGHFELPGDLPWLLVFSGISFLAWLISALTFLLLQSIPGRQLLTSNVFPKLSLTFPLSRANRWLVCALPRIIIAFIIFCFSLPVINALSNGFELPLALFVIAVVLGLLSGLGFSMLQLKFFSTHKIFLLFGTLILGLMLFKFSLDTHSQSTTSFYLLLVLASVFVYLFGLAQSYFYPTYMASYTPKVFSWLPENTLYRLWYLYKLARNNRTVNSYIVGFSIALAVAVFAGYKHFPIVYGIDWFMLAAFVACAFGVDVRGISRRHKLPELAEARNLAHFIQSTSLSALIVALVIGSPIYIVTLMLSDMNFLVVSAAYLSVQFAAVCLGLLVSSLLVPQDGDIGSQFLAGVLASLSLYIIPKITNLPDMALPQRDSTWAVVGFMALLVIILVEHERTKAYADA